MVFVLCRNFVEIFHSSTHITYNPRSSSLILQRIDENAPSSTPPYHRSSRYRVCCHSHRQRRQQFVSGTTLPRRHYRERSSRQCSKTIKSSRMKLVPLNSIRCAATARTRKNVGLIAQVGMSTISKRTTIAKISCCTLGGVKWNG